MINKIKICQLILMQETPYRVEILCDLRIFLKREYHMVKFKCMKVRW